MKQLHATAHVVLAVLLLIGLVGSGCGQPEYGRRPSAGVGFRLLRTSPCEGCSQFDDGSVYVFGANFWLPPAADIEISPLGVREIEAVRIAGDDGGLDTWEAHIVFESSALDSLRAYRKSRPRRDSVVVVSLGDQIVDSFYASQLVPPIFVGKFESKEELESAFGVAAAGVQNIQLPEDSELERLRREFVPGDS